MKKAISILIIFLFISVISFSQNCKENTILTIGHYFKDDISFTIGGRFTKDIYATYEHNYSFDTHLQSNYMNLGVRTDKSIVYIKWGAKTEPFETTHVNYFDYGVEYLWIMEKYNQRFLYGLSLTKRNGVGLKIGMLF